MANNRIYLRCKNCGKGFFLGKCFGWQYGTSEDYYKYGFINELNNFYTEHCGCVEEEDKVDVKYLEPRFKKEDRDYENQFEIAYDTFYNDEDLESKEENKNLKENISDSLTYDLAVARIKELEYIINKAIKLINKRKKDVDNVIGWVEMKTKEYFEECDELIDILQGEDND